MAPKHGAHKTTKAYVVSVVEDFCKSPTAPVGYMISQVLEVSEFVCTTVNGCGTPALNMQSRVMTVVGNEAGVGGGVKSSVNKGICKPIKDAAGSVRAEGHFLLRHCTVMEMNCASYDGPGNTFGILKYQTQPNKCEGQPPMPPAPICPAQLEPWMWVDIDLNDIAHVVVGAALIPVAIIIRPLIELFPETVGGFVVSLPSTTTGTGDKSGVGVLIGNNSGDGKGTPGVVGIAFSLSHKLFEILGLDQEGGVIDGARYEKGQGEEGHDGKTGVGFESDGFNSFGETVGQLLGIVFRWLGLGDEFYSMVEAILGPPDGYGFVSGVWKGTHQLPK
jgi:hypothetical protein